MKIRECCPEHFRIAQITSIPYPVLRKFMCAVKPGYFPVRGTESLLELGRPTQGIEPSNQIKQWFWKVFPLYKQTTEPAFIKSVVLFVLNASFKIRNIPKQSAQLLGVTYKAEMPRHTPRMIGKEIKPI